MVEAKKRKVGDAHRNAPGSKRRRFVAKIKEQRVAEKTFSFNAPVAPQRLPPSQPPKSEATATVPEWMRNGIASLQSSPTVLGRLFGSCFFRASRLGSASAASNESAQRVLMRLLGLQLLLLSKHGRGAAAATIIATIVAPVRIVVQRLPLPLPVLVLVLGSPAPPGRH